LTAGKFLPDPWSATPGARLYRTGDRARYRPDGNLEFLGRLDHQVKIRGFRIELGEIEAALATLPGVREAVVVVREDAPGDRRLVAYVTGDAAAADDLRSSLQERLPEPMVPAAFVSLAALPLTPNGKVDRKALPAPEWQRAEESHLAPRTPAEEILAGIWAEVLGLDRVGATDHFFELGGHSLLATQVMSRVGEAFGVELPLRELFEAPVLADLAAQVEAARREGVARTAPPLVPVPRGGPLPLSFAQQRLWFIEQFAPGNTLYNIPMALRVEGPLRPEVLALCLGEIARRHEVLRTVFAARDGLPLQVIQAAAPFSLPLVDLSGLPAERREATALALAGEEAGRPFDLTGLGRGPLLRAVLLRLQAADHVVAPTLHHIAGDGWSLGVLVREITALYAAAVEGRPSPLPELPVQYADYSVWQHAWLRGEVLEGEIAFWRRQLAGLPPLLELPADRPRPAVQSPRGASEPLRLPAGLARRVQALGRREGATLFMVLLAGFDALLARYSGQPDLAVGTPVAGRNRVEIEGLIGFFVNTLVLRADLSGGPSFRELLARVREAALAAHAHQDVPFEKLVQELAPERSLAHTPLFQVMLSMQSFPSTAIGLPGLSMTPVALETTAVRFDLELTFAEEGDELGARLDFASGLFDRATIRRLAGHLEALLEGATADPDQRLSELPLLAAAEGHQLLAEWNDTGPPLPERVLLHDLVEAQARSTPDAPAVTFDGETLTYAGLHDRADRLARHLRDLGCGAESRAGVALERSLDLIVALLGVLRAGAAYVPLDPGYPRERLALVLEDAAPRVLVTRTPLLAALPPFPGEVLCLDGEPIYKDVTARAPVPGDDRQLAYVLYTSGSTGRPKGVGVPHRALVSFLRSMQGAPGFAAGERLLAVTPVAFDIAALEIFLPLITGGCVELAGREEAADGRLLA
ncbi:MAG TPA: condensation domain-containing protein, partial [Thermoanaerobaculia bacterium]|nr:condensation domain-containing protein [Thermoanaerobaculia bacterium]